MQKKRHVFATFILYGFLLSHGIHALAILFTGEDAFGSSRPISPLFMLAMGVLDICLVFIFWQVAKKGDSWEWVLILGYFMFGIISSPGPTLLHTLANGIAGALFWLVLLKVFFPLINKQAARKYASTSNEEMYKWKKR